MSPTRTTRQNTPFSCAGAGLHMKCFSLALRSLQELFLLLFNTSAHSDAQEITVLRFRELQHLQMIYRPENVNRGRSHWEQTHRLCSDLRFAVQKQLAQTLMSLILLFIWNCSAALKQKCSQHAKTSVLSLSGRSLKCPYSWVTNRYSGSVLSISAVYIHTNADFDVMILFPLFY